MFRDNILQIVVLLAGVLRGEKVELAAAVKKQQVRIQHLEEALEKAMKEVSWKSPGACHDGYHFLVLGLVQ